MTDRAQSFTLEAVAAALLLVGTLVFVTGAAGVTPTTASTSSEQVPGGLQGVAAGALDAGLANGTVAPTLLYWNDSSGAFHGAGEDGYYVGGGPPTAFGALLNRTFDERGAAFNVHVVHVNDSGARERVPLVRQGTPTDDAVRVTRAVTLTDDDALRDADGNRTNATVASAGFYVPDDAPDTPVYAVVYVEVVAWPV